jgi:Putative peptidoglycan binding domain
MKIGSLLAVIAAGILLSTSSASAGWGRGCYGGGWRGGPGWYGPPVSLGFFFAPPVPVYRPVYVTQPVYVQSGYGYRGQSYENSLLASAQARLARLGYYRGYVDGSFGPQTSRAVRNYQIDNGLPVTGRLDGRTLSSLGV